jgi:hypothetical protein
MTASKFFWNTDDMDRLDFHGFIFKTLNCVNPLNLCHPCSFSKKQTL